MPDALGSVSIGRSGGWASRDVTGALGFVASGGKLRRRRRRRHASERCGHSSQWRHDRFNRPRLRDDHASHREIDVHVDDLTINGPGRDTLTIDGNDNGRVFRHDGAGTLTISGLTIANGVLNSDIEPNPFRNTYGGCILSDHGTEEGASPYGSVALIDSTVTHCSVIAGANALPGRARGGGIAAAGNVTVQRRHAERLPYL